MNYEGTSESLFCLDPTTVDHLNQAVQGAEFSGTQVLEPQVSGPCRSHESKFYRGM
jgi:hypothetical protein